jgi:hypothetical protein
MSCFVRLDIQDSDMPKRVQIGDIIEIPTAKGLAYAQYTHQHRTHGGLIRVFDALFDGRPDDFLKLVNGTVRFSTFFPVAAAIKRGVFNVVDHENVAPHNQLFPVFRNGVTDPKTKKVAVWWFWDGEREWKVGTIAPEQRKMPIVGVWNDTLLIERIESGWTPSSDPS